MRTHLRIIILCLLIGAVGSATAQNCTINAGVTTELCPKDVFELHGTSSGLIATNGVWSQIDGPAVTIVNPNSLTSQVTGYTQDKTYKFRITATCKDGSLITNDVTYTTHKATIANAGPDMNICAGSSFLPGNQPAANEKGAWLVIGANNDMTLVDPTKYNAEIKAPDSLAAKTTYRWTITNNDNGCISYDDVDVYNASGRTPVFAGDDVTLPNCYTVTQSVNMRFATYGGDNINGQQGTWTLVSGPTVPVFDNIHKRDVNITELHQGVYVFRWTVVGPCVNGTDDIKVTVPAPTQDVTQSYNITETFCDGRTSTLLVGPKPKYVNETFTWKKQWGPGNIADPNSYSTVITDLLNGSGQHEQTSLHYIIENQVTHCATEGFYTINFADPTSINITPSITAPCGATSADIAFTAVGGDATKWSIISAPVSSSIYNSGLGSYYDVSGQPMHFEGMDVTGEYFFRFKRATNVGTGGCLDAYADAVVHVSRKPTASNAGTKQVLGCNILETQLAGNVPTSGTGTWSQVGGPSMAAMADKTDPTTQITGLTHGTYVFRWIITGNVGCENQQSDVSVVVADAQPSAAAAGPDETICNSTPYVLKANKPVLNESGTWITVAPTTGVTFSNVNDPHSIISGLAPNTAYTLGWVISNACGSDTDEVVITTSDKVGPQQALAGPDICLPSGNTSFTLAGNTPTGTEAGKWNILTAPSAITLGNATQNNTTVNGAIDGTYRLEWVLSTIAGCTPTRDTVLVTIANPTTQADAGTEQTVCSVSTITLAGNTPTSGTGRWTQEEGPGGAVITDVTNPHTTVTGIQEGRYRFRWSILNGGCDSTFADVRINSFIAPTPAVSGGDKQVCGASSFVLAASPVTLGTGLWTVTGGPGNAKFTDPTNPTTTISNLTAGVYSLVWITRNGGFCSSASNMKLTVTASAKSVTDTFKLCNVVSVNLVGNDGSVGKWTAAVANPASTLDSITPSAALASGLVPGNTYKFGYTIDAIGICPATSDTATVIISLPPSPANAGADKEVCLIGATPGSVTLAAGVPVVGTGMWKVITPTSTTAHLVNPGADNSVFDNLTPNIYLLEWTVSNGYCVNNTDVVRVTAYAEPSAADAGADQPDACVSEVTLKGNTPVTGIGTWSYVDGPNTPTIDAPNSPETKVSDMKTGTYHFRWAITNGNCMVQADTVEIIVTSDTASTAHANPVAITPGEKCNLATTTSVNLQGSAPVAAETGKWSIISATTGGATFGDAAAFTTTLDNLKDGTYKVRWTISNGSCHSNDSLLVKIYDSPTPADGGGARTICKFSALQLVAGTPVTRGIGTWTFDNGPSAPVLTKVDESKADVGGLDVGDYVFNFTTTNGICPASGPVPVNIKVEDCRVTVVKTVSTPALNADGTYKVVFTFVITNPGSNVAINDVQVADNLNGSFPAPNTFTVKVPTVTGALTSAAINTAFNGNTDQNLLKAGTSLAPGASATIKLEVNVTLN